MSEPYYKYVKGRGWVCGYWPDTERYAAKPVNFGFDPVRLENLREAALRWQAAHERVFTVDLETTADIPAMRQYRQLVGRILRHAREETEEEEREATRREWARYREWIRYR